MKFYKLWRNNVGLDENEGHVVIARNEAHARQICNLDARDEGMIWENPDIVDCIKIDDLSKPGIVLTSFIGGGL